MKRFFSTFFIIASVLISNCSIPVFAEEENNFTVGGTYISNCSNFENYNKKLYKIEIISDNQEINTLDGLIELLNTLKLELKERERND